MLPRLVPEILVFYAFCDVGVVLLVGGIGDSRSWIIEAPSIIVAKCHGAKPSKQIFTENRIFLTLFLGGTVKTKHTLM